MVLHLLHGDGTYQRAVVGPPPRGDGWQLVIPHGVWFAAEVLDDAGYALVGCTVAPGFDYADFELADGAALREQYPQHKALIARLT
jgi:predicted cupin superfamily sugar epimerase